MKKTAGIILLCAVLLAGCSSKADEGAGAAPTTAAETTVTGQTENAPETTTEAAKDDSKEETTTGASEAASADPSQKTSETEGKETKAGESQTAAAPETTEAATTAASVSAPITHSGYVFQAGNAVIGMNEDSEPILAALGAWNDYFEAESCAFQGLDKTYTYPSFELYTYPKGNRDMVNSITLLDDSVSTPEGIKIGSAEADIVAAYGEGYVLENGVYQYTKDKSILSIFTTGGVVDGIEYTAITE